MNTKHIYTVKLGDLAEIPGSPYAYWASKSLRELFQKYPPLDRDIAGQKDKPKIADVKVGLQTSDDLRFTRFWWEVDTNNIAAGREETYHKKWVPFLKGTWVEKYFADISMVVTWLNKGEEIRNFENAVIRNEDFYFRKGLSWSAIFSSPRIDMHVMPPGGIFTQNHFALFTNNESLSYILLSVMNSELIAFLTHILDPLEHTRIQSTIAKLPMVLSIIQNKILVIQAQEAHSLLREHDTGNETSTQFIKPWLLQAWRGFSHDGKPVTKHPLANDFQWCKFDSAKELRGEDKKWDKEASIIALANECVQRELKLRKKLDEIQNTIDDEVYCIYGISEEDRSLIEEISATVVGTEEEKVKTENEENPYEVMPAEEHIKRLLSYFALEIMKEDEDGIVPVSDMFLGTRKEPGMATRVIEKLINEFGENNLDRIETELTKVLKMSIEEWFAKDFFDYHTTLYRLRPVIWELSCERLKHGKGKSSFSCFSYWHKLDEDTIPKARQLYLKPVFEASRMEVENIKSKLSKVEGKEKREVENELESALTKYEELKTFDEAFENLLKPHELKVTSKSKWVEEKVEEITQDGYKPERDYGVRVNIEPLKQAGVMAKTADRVKG